MKGIPLLCALSTVLGTAAETLPLAPSTHVERVPIAGAAELVTVFATRPAVAGAPTEDVPMVSILRDTLHDPSSERLRNLWVFTFARPTWAQRIAAAFPFYHRASSRAGQSNRPPAAILDLSAPERHTWAGLAGVAIQSEFLA